MKKNLASTMLLLTVFFLLTNNQLFTQSLKIFPADEKATLTLKFHTADTVIEAQVVMKQWRNHYNRIRPDCALGYLPLALKTYFPYQVASA